MGIWRPFCIDVGSCFILPADEVDSATRMALGLAGAYVVGKVWQSIIVTMILPRRVKNYLTYFAWLVTFWAITPIAIRIDDHRRRDALLAYLAPVNILVLLFVWLTALIIGFASMFAAFEGVGAWQALDLAGSSIFTLGYASNAPGWSRVLLYLAAGSGITVVAVLAGFLPTVYAAYSAREALVTKLSMRCTENLIITGALVLVYHPLPQSSKLLSDLYGEWESAAASITESHRTYPWLVFFRSPRASESWLTCMLAVLDSISILEAAAPDALPASAQHCKFACTMALAALAELVRPKLFSLEKGAYLDDEIFAAALSRIVFPLASDRGSDTVWNNFRQARRAYEPAAIALGSFLLRPDDGWLCPTSDAGCEP